MSTSSHEQQSSVQSSHEAGGSPQAASQPLTAVEVIRRGLEPHLLTRGRVVIIGLGGIGLWLTRAVVAFLAGLRTALGPDEDIDVVLVDGKVFADRHTYRLDVPDYVNKAVAEELLDRHECPGLNVRAVPEFVTDENVDRLIRNGDCVLMGVDNHATRSLVGGYCAGGRLDDVVLISGGNDGVEDGNRGTYGNVQLYLRESGVDRTAPLPHFHPEIADPADHSPAEPGCDESGAPQLTITNMLAASMIASTLLRLLMPPADQRPYDEVAFDVVEATAQPHWLSAPPSASSSPDRG